MAEKGTFLSADLRALVSENWVVAEAVQRNQSPERDFPANREINREF